MVSLLLVFPFKPEKILIHDLSKLNMNQQDALVKEWIWNKVITNVLANK